MLSVLYVVIHILMLSHLFVVGCFGSKAVGDQFVLLLVDRLHDRQRFPVNFTSKIGVIMKLSGNSGLCIEIILPWNSTRNLSSTWVRTSALFHTVSSSTPSLYIIFSMLEISLSL
ncbi:hypothetical protein LINGRAHAP2_LOCUS11410 [Linum grandiflorum]